MTPRATLRRMSECSERPHGRVTYAVRALACGAVASRAKEDDRRNELELASPRHAPRGLEPFHEIENAMGAGYKVTRTEHGSGLFARYVTTIEKTLGGKLMRADGESNAQKVADRQALSALNAQRAHRYASSGLTVDQD